MARNDPTPAFDKVTLDIANIGVGQAYYRIFEGRHPDPLGFGKTRSRFSDPHRIVESKRFGVLYLGSSIDVCFLEAVLRDKRNNIVGDYPLSEAYLNTLKFATIVPAKALSLVDLDGNGPVRMGVPSDVVRASNQALARRWSNAIFQHPTAPDGIFYPSRLSGATNLAVYDRAIASKLSVSNVQPLMSVPDMARVLDEYKVALT